MPVPAEISQLVERFERNYDQYHSLAFSEAAVRHQFIRFYPLQRGSDDMPTQPKNVVTDTP